MSVAAAPFLDPALLARIADLPLLARTVVDGVLHGLHRTRRPGASLDFAEHRPYQPGDDLRRIDWRVSGRTDRYVVRQYEADTNAGVIFAVDASASMDFGSGPLTKFSYARALCASLAWLARRQGDRVGLATLDDGVRAFVPPSARHLPELLQQLARTTPAGAGDLLAAVDRVARLDVRAGIVALATDAYVAPDAFARQLALLRARGHDVVVFHVRDAAERDLPDTADGTFEDAELGVRLPVQPAAWRERYRAMVDGHVDALRRALGAIGADYVRCDTDQPLDGALRAWLAHRGSPVPESR